MKRNSKVKIVCTIGPASWDPDVMRRMIENGMNVARVNGAFADPAELEKVTKLVRDVSDDVALMVDVKGPEVRMNKFPAPIALKPGMEVITGSTEEDAIYPANYLHLYQFVSPGQRLMVGDGDVELRVVKVENGRMFTEVVFGEVLKPGKALNVPGCEYSSDVLTEKDMLNLKHSIALGWDFCSASFMQNAENARYVKSIIGESHMQLIAKIEDQEGVNNIDEILEVVDGVMIARGGLGVELGLEKVPMVQRLLTRKCNEVGKPVITATQMLESMITNPRPTRAEINDVALAVMLGSDAVMLSGESSAGEYPVDAVKTLTAVASETMNHVSPMILPLSGMNTKSQEALAKGVAEFAINMDDTLDKVLIVSESGCAARQVAKYGIRQPIYAFTGDMGTARTMMLSKGIIDADVLVETSNDADEFVKIVINTAISKGYVEKGEKVVVYSRSDLENEYNFRNVFEFLDTSQI